MPLSEILLWVLAGAALIIALGFAIKKFMDGIDIPATDFMDRDDPPSPASTDISDTIEELLGRPGVVFMSAKKGQEFHVKTNALHTDAGQEYTSVGRATIIVIPEDV